MAGGRKLAAARGARTARTGGVILLLLLLALCVPASAQELSSDSARQSAAQKAFDAGQWDEAARLARGPENQSADLDFLAGLALAKLQRWNDARTALAAGLGKAPTQARFLVELAGVDYKRHESAEAKRELRAALKLEPKDAYTHDFLGTLY